MGVGILTTYTQIANIAGIQGLMVYVLAGALPIIMFSFLGPVIRRRCPEGFVLTEWCYRRYGPIMGLCLSAATVFTIFLFMISELTAVGDAINVLTGLDQTPAIVVECIVTTIYTFMGGFAVSFVTDTFQATLVLVVAVIAIIGYATEIDINTTIKDETYDQLMGSNKIGWMVFYILNVAILTNDMFMSGFWLRTFAAKTSKDLYIATGIASFVVAVISTLAGLPGIIAVWTGDLTISDPNSSYAFFILIANMHKWIIGVVLIFCVLLSTCTFDSLQSAITSSISNDLFRNKFPMIYSRILVIVIMIPALVIAIECSANVLQIYFIADLLSSAIVPIMFLGLSKHFFFLRGLDIIVGSLSALLAVFVFGCIYYGDAKDGGLLLLIWNGVYDPNDWGAFGAFVVAPVSGVIFGLMCAGLRISILYLISRHKGTEFHALDKPTTIAFGVVTKEDGIYEPETEIEVEFSSSVTEGDAANHDAEFLSESDSTSKKSVEIREENVREILKEFKWKDMLHLLV
jgi:Na+/proline symporter